MAPELITRRQISAASDIYALGIVFYEMLTLEKPFLGENPGEIIRAILENEPLQSGPFPLRPHRRSSRPGYADASTKIPGQRPADEDLLAAFSAGNWPFSPSGRKIE